MWKIFSALILSAALSVWVLIGQFANSSVEKAVSRDAVHKSLQWAHYMSERVPEIQDLLATGVPTQEQQQAIRLLRQLGEVFRFKLFDQSGRLVLISDESFIADPRGIATEADPEPSQVLASGVEVVDVFDGTEKADRPDLYAEAYIPLKDADRQVYGVVEVYVDVTLTRQYFLDSFRSFGIIVSAVSALLFLLPALAFGVQRMIAARSRSEAEYLSKFDVLTGLLNRAEFTRRAQGMLDDGHLSALVFLDADKFKAINDTHGHAVGDAFLEKIGRVLAASADAGDLVARFGGDEFVMAFGNVHKDVVVKRLRNVIAQCSKPLETDGRTVVGSVSAGIVTVAGDGCLDHMMAHADAALYHAKAAGRNQYAFYGDDMGDAIRHRNRLEQRIKEAALGEEFEIAYQPLVNGTTKELEGYEALLRLNHQDGTPISPAEFIPMAEEIGFINEIGSWTIRQAIRQVASQSDYLKIAINLSVSQFNDGNLPSILREVISETGIESARIELEITESLLINDEPSVAFQIDALQEMGISIAMDDFGTGFSSLGYLWKYGFDRIKIDQSFVAGLGDGSERSLQIIETIVTLGQRLGMKITAEGVETEDQSAQLSELGCDVLQGYYYGRPSNLAEHDYQQDTRSTA